MTDLELRDALNTYTQQGADREKVLKQKLFHKLAKSRTSRFPRGLAVAAAAVLVLSLAALTPPGRAISADVGRTVAGWIEAVFPPKDVTVAPEGEEETILHTPHGEEPSSAAPGYVIYVDEEIYHRTEIDDLSVIEPQEPITALCDDGTPLPPCRLTVEHRSDLSSSDAAETIAAELGQQYAQVERCGESPLLSGALLLRANDGTNWDDAHAEAHVIDDGCGGVYILTAQYFTEAEEGHGARFSAMISTFELVE